MSASSLTTPSFVVGADHETAEVGIAGTAVDLRPGDDRHFLSADQPDPAREVGQDVLVEAEAERKDIVAFEEERALLRKEEREPREVRPPRVDFGLGEIGIGRD